MTKDKDAAGSISYVDGAQVPGYEYSNEWQNYATIDASMIENATIQFNPVATPWQGNDDGSQTAYMCLTDFENELGNAADPTNTYPSVEALKADRECCVIDDEIGCGIVEVRIYATRIVQPQQGW